MKLCENIHVMQPNTTLKWCNKCGSQKCAKTRRMSLIILMTGT